MKRLVTWILAAMLVLSWTGALAEDNFNPTGWPVVKETVTLNIATSYNARQKPYNELKLYQDYEAATNVHIEWNLIPESEWPEKKSLMLMSGNLPDLILGGLSDKDVFDNAASGNFIAMDEYIDQYAPNIQSLFEQRPQVRQLWSLPDGKLYQLGRVEEMFGLVHTHGLHYINKTWLDKFNLPVPQTTEEYKQALKTFVENDANGNGIADEIGFSFLDSPSGVWRNHGNMGSLFGAFGRPDTGDHIYVKDGKVVFTAAEPEYKAGIQYFADLYQEGLIDIEAFTQTEAQLIAKGSAADAVYGSFIKWDASHAVGINRAAEYVNLPPLKGPDGHQEWSRENLTEWGTNKNFAVITKACKNPEIAVRWLDLGLSKEWSPQINWGMLGEVYEKDEAGKLIPLPLPEGMDIESRRGTSTPAKNPHAILDYYYDSVVEYPPDASDMLRQRQEYYFPYMNEEFYPEVVMSMEDTERVLKLSVDINTITDEARARWITMGGVDEEWDGYLQQLKDAGLEEYLTLKQAGLDAYFATAQ